MNKMELPFGKTEKEHNDFCDTMKCKHGNYCNVLLGLCVQCKEDMEVKE